MMIRKIFGPKRNEIKEVSRKLHSIPTEFYGLHSSRNIVRVIKLRRIKFAGQIAQMVEGRGTYRIFVEKSERKSPL
jgi:hypothetical protein